MAQSVRCIIFTFFFSLLGSKFTEVVLGAHELQSEEDEQQRQKVDASDYKFHPEYDVKKLGNDIALLPLPDPVQYNEYVQPIKLPIDFASDSFAGEQATVSGWGRTDDGQVSHMLRSVSVKVISNDVCRKTWHRYVLSGTLCVQTNKKGGSCQNDYGGPVTINKNGETIQIGVITFGGNCTLG